MAESSRCDYCGGRLNPRNECESCGIDFTPWVMAGHRRAGALAWRDHSEGGAACHTALWGVRRAVILRAPGGPWRAYVEAPGFAIRWAAEPLESLEAAKGWCEGALGEGP